MRIVAGKFGGRVLFTPKTGSIRPTQDRVRESLFNIIAGTVPNAAFLDLFAGSGSVGLEALSRGAASATFVERDRRHAEVLKRNIAALGPDAAARSTVIVADAYRWIESFSGTVPIGFVGSVPTPMGTPMGTVPTGFSIVFADPPYALGEERGYESVLATLAERNIVRPGGLFIAESESAQQPVHAAGWELVRDRTYGKTRLAIWRRP